MGYYEWRTISSILLDDGTKPLTEPMLTSVRWHSHEGNTTVNVQASILYNEFERYIAASPKGNKIPLYHITR